MTVDTMARTVGQLLREARGTKSMRRAGAELGVTDRTYKMWEADFAAPEPDKAGRIAAFAGVSRYQVLHLMGVLDEADVEVLEDAHGLGYEPAGRPANLTSAAHADPGLRVRDRYLARFRPWRRGDVELAA